MEKYSEDNVNKVVEKLLEKLLQDKCTYKIPNDICVWIKSHEYKLFYAKSNDILGTTYNANIVGHDKDISITDETIIKVGECDLKDEQSIYGKITPSYETIETLSDTKKVIRYKIKEETVSCVDCEGTDKYYIGWVTVCDREASLVERYVKLVVLKLLTELIDKMDYFLRDDGLIQKRVEKYIEQSRFNFTERYVETVFEKMEFNKTVGGVDVTKSEFIKLLGYKEYEKRQCCSSVLFASKSKLKQLNKNAICYCVDDSVKDGVTVKALLNRFRKALEICNNRELFLVVEQNEFKIRGIIKEKIEDTWVIDFSKKGEWLIKYNDEHILFYVDGTYNIPDKEKQQNKIQQLLNENKGIDITIEKAVLDKLEKVFESQEHGALLIICKDACQCVNNLCYRHNRGVKIRNLDMNKEGNEIYLAGMLSVDGAVFMTDKGICHGFGVILDGMAIVRGRDDRGARYNSAVNYIEGKEMLAIIKSEDKENGIEILYGKH